MAKTLKTRCSRNVATGSRNTGLSTVANHLLTSTNSTKDLMLKSLYLLRRRKKRDLKKKRRLKRKKRRKRINRRVRKRRRRMKVRRGLRLPSSVLLRSFNALMSSMITSQMCGLTEVN